MQIGQFIHCLEQNPVIAAIGDDKWEAALVSPVKVLFYLSADILTVKQRIDRAHEAGKLVLIHVDTAEGNLLLPHQPVYGRGGYSAGQRSEY